MNGWADELTISWLPTYTKPKVLKHYDIVIIRSQKLRDVSSNMHSWESEGNEGKKKTANLPPTAAEMSFGVSASLHATISCHFSQLPSY